MYHPVLFNIWQALPVVALILSLGIISIDNVIMIAWTDLLLYAFSFAVFEVSFWTIASLNAPTPNEKIFWKLHKNITKTPISERWNSQKTERYVNTASPPFLETASMDAVHCLKTINHCFHSLFSLIVLWNFQGCSFLYVCFFKAGIHCNTWIDCCKKGMPQLMGFKTGL